MKKLLIGTLTFMLTSFALLAQGKYGKDSLECTKYLSYYREYMKQNNMDMASTQWRQAIKYCPPTANQTMLLDGMKILRKDIFTHRNNPIRKDELVDSLFMLHDMRISTYTEAKYYIPANANKALDYIKYLGEDDDSEGYALMGHTMDELKHRTPVSVVLRYMQYANNLYASGEILDTDVVESFEKSVDVAESIEADLVKRNKSTETIEKAISDLESMFIESGVATCENLVKLFQPRYDSHKDNKEELGIIVSLLNSSACTEEQLFLDAVESLHALEATHTSAYFLYQLHARSNNIEEAKKYILEAVNYEESDKDQDAEYLFELASVMYVKAGDIEQAVKYAKQAINTSSIVAGKANFLIGTIWGGVTREGNDIEKRAVYWVAVDYFNKAKAADKSLSEEANKYIASYSKYFPLQDEAFMYDIINGSSYTVTHGGLTEKTIVRTQN